MKTLVFDTCFNKSYIVLKDDDCILDSKIIESTESNYHSAFLIPSLRDILKENDLRIKDLDAIGVNIGPGSFTGIRAGITIARVLAQQSGIKLVGVSSLQILSKLNDTDKKAIVVTDARKNKVYYAEYKFFETFVSPVLLEKEELFTHIDDNSFVIADSSISAFLSERNISNINFEEKDVNLGLYLSEITSFKLKNSDDDFHWAKVKPLYIQPPSITKPKAVKYV